MSRRRHSPRFIRICCVPPSELPHSFILPDGSVKRVYPPGLNGGVMKPFRCVKDPSITHWIEVDETETGDKASEDLQCLKHAAALIRVSPDTLYTYASRLRSLTKIRRLDFFHMPTLLNVDRAYVEGFRAFRKAMEAERKERRDLGEVRRAGPHVRGCPGDHLGKCERRRTQEWERTKVTEEILNGLGKKNRKR